MKLFIALMFVSFSVFAKLAGPVGQLEIEKMLDDKMGGMVVATTASWTASTSYAMPEVIPADSVIVDSFYIINTVVASANNNTLSLTCGNATITAADTLAGDATATFVQSSVVDGTVAGYQKVGSSNCHPTVNVGAGASGITGGQVDFFIRYFTKK